MGKRSDGASPGSAGAMDPPATAVDSLVDLAGAPPSEEADAKILGKMWQQLVPSSSEEGEEDEEEEEVGEKQEDDKGGETKERTSWRLPADTFKYSGCSWPGVVGLKVNKAKRIIGKGKPDIYFEVVSRDQMLTMCYCTRRVRLMVDRSNCVVETPHIG